MASIAGFSLFPDLPPEIRCQIWRHALPDTPATSYLFPYKRGYWQPGHLPPSFINHHHQDVAQSNPFNFRSDLMEGLRFEVPFALVSHEAREVALDWVRRQPLPTHSSRQTSPAALVRGFDIENDVLYSPLEKWNDFLDEPLDGQEDLHQLNGRVSTTSTIRYIALPEDVCHLQKYIQDIFYVFCTFPSIENLLLVARDSAHIGETNVCKYADAPGTTKYTWTPQDRKFHTEDGEVVEDVDPRHLISQALSRMRWAFDTRVLNRQTIFEVRTVIAQAI